MRPNWDVACEVGYLKLNLAKIYILAVPHFIKGQTLFLLSLKELFNHFSVTSTPHNTDCLVNFWKWATLTGLFEFNQLSYNTLSDMWNVKLLAMFKT